MKLLLVHLLSFALSWSLVAAIPNPIVPPPSNIDPDNPSASDPTAPPQSLSFPSKAPKPPPIENLPEICDGEAPSDDCFKALGSGSYIKFDPESQCTEDQKSTLETAVWDAFTLALWSANFPDVDGVHGQAAGKYYMGPDYANFQGRITGNLKRAAAFKGTPGSSESITVSCKDEKMNCGKVIDRKAVGGYAWSKHYFGWGWYHYITLCPAYFSLDSLDTKMSDVEDDLRRGSTTMATDMAWLRTTGQFFLHEMMHLQLVYNGEPEIIDEYVAPKADNPGSWKAYGANLVHKLASRELEKGGGATRASTNADSYAVLANCLWWWSVTGYFPGVPDTTKSQSDSIDDTPVFLHIDLQENNTNVTTADFNALYDAELSTYGEPPDQDPDNDTSQSSSGPDNLECHGISGDVFILNSGIAIQNAKSFCSQSEMSVQ
jgi:hypothetical protein